MAVEMCADKVLSITLKPEDKTLAATPTVFVWRAPFIGRVLGFYAIDQAGVAADPTNYMTLTLTNAGQAGAGTTSMATAVGTAAFTAEVPKAFTLSTTAANLEFVAGDIIELIKTEAASGQDFVEVTFQLDVVAGRS
jgi:hypothetical protein